MFQAKATHLRWLPRQQQLLRVWAQQQQQQQQQQ
jgi:hypothetical protein